MKWVLSIITILLLVSWNFRWSVIEESVPIQGNTIVTYVKDNWTNTTWVQYDLPNAFHEHPKELSLASETDRFESYDELRKEHQQRGLYDFLVEDWRERDFVTYVWFTHTLFSFIGASIFWIRSLKERKLYKNSHPV